MGESSEPDGPAPESDDIAMRSGGTPGASALLVGHQKWSALKSTRVEAKAIAKLEPLSVDGAAR